MSTNKPALPDHIYLPPLTSSDGSRSRHLLVYFITGNPGIIGYYIDFLKAVREHLHATHKGGDQAVHIYGQNLAGFETSSETKSRIPDGPLTLDDQFDDASARAAGPFQPLNLAQQVHSVAQNIRRKVHQLRGEVAVSKGRVERSSSSSPQTQVLLIGHSVGSYIALEVIAKQHEYQRQQTDPDVLEYVGAICLFPTVVEIANSEKGRALSGLLSIPYLPSIAQFIAGLFTYIPSTGLLDWAAAFTPGALHKDATEALFRSKNGIRQLLYLANDEMRTIKEDRWLPELWGSSSSSSSSGAPFPSPLIRSPKLFFYWGHSDYWVDNRVRDALIAQRGSRGPADPATRAWPDMLISTHPDMDHCFSLNLLHTDVVARQVAEWIVAWKRDGRRVGVEELVR